MLISTSKVMGRASMLINLNPKPKILNPKP